MQTKRHGTLRQALGLAMLAIGGLAMSSSHGSAQGGYPERTIRIISISSAGSPADMTARLVGDKLAAAWGQPVVVEPKVGAGGSLAAGYVAKAAPDGYTLLMSGDAAMVTNLHLYKSLSYDPVKDLAPISQVAFTTNILAVPTSLPVANVQELVALARSEPDKITVAHGGLGFSQHLAAEMFKAMAGLKINVIPFRGALAIMPNLIAGRVSMCFCNITAVLPLVREGKLKALAVTSLKRSQFAPDLPTMAESGFPGFDINAWFGLLAPAGTPAPIIAKLHAGTARALATADVRESFKRLGMEMIGNAPAEFASVIRAEIPLREKTIAGAGIEPQ